MNNCVACEADARWEDVAKLYDSVAVARLEVYETRFVNLLMVCDEGHTPDAIPLAKSSTEVAVDASPHCNRR